MLKAVISLQTKFHINYGLRNSRQDVVVVIFLKVFFLFQLFQYSNDPFSYIAGEKRLLKVTILRPPLTL